VISRCVGLVALFVLIPLQFAAERLVFGFAGLYDGALRGIGQWLGFSGDRLAWTIGSTRGELRRPLWWLVLAAERLADKLWVIHGLSGLLAGATCCLMFAPAIVVALRRRDAWKAAGTLTINVSAMLAGFFCAAAWLNHPVNVEAVACASQQGTVLGGALLAASAFLWWRALTRPDGRPRFVAPLVLLGLALLADPTLCFAAVALFALTRFVRRDGSIDDVKRPLVVASILGALAFVASYAVREPGGGAPFVPALFATATQIVRPIRSLVWPVGLHPGYDPPPGWPAEIGPSLCVDLGTAATLAIACVWGLRRRHGLGYALLAYFAFLAGRVLLGRDEVGADGDAFVATIPLVLAAGVLAARLVGGGGRLRAALGIVPVLGVTAVCIALSEDQTTPWKNSRTLVEHVLAVDPTNERALVAMGDAARARGAPLAEATSWYRRALEAGDWRPLAHARLGGALIESGDEAGARRHLERAIEIAPWTEAARFDLGALDLRNGSFDSARTHLEAATRLDAGSAEAWRLLAMARDGAGDAKGALEAMRRAAALRPDDPRIAEALRDLEK